MQHGPRLPLVLLLSPNTSSSQYFIVADASSAVNTGQGDLQVTFSRGYKRQNLIVDGGFEAYDECTDFCFTESYAHWGGSSPSGGYFDASIFYFSTYARTGHGSALLGSATLADDKSGTLQAGQPLATEAGKKYQIAFFQNSAFSGPTFQAKSIVEVLWNGKVVQTIKPGFTEWKFHSVDVEAVGNDILAFRGGAAPAWTFLDDISVWPMFQ